MLEGMSTEPPHARAASGRRPIFPWLAIRLVFLFGAGRDPALRRDASQQLDDLVTTGLTGEQAKDAGAVWVGAGAVWAAVGGGLCAAAGISAGEVAALAVFLTFYAGAAAAMGGGVVLFYGARRTRPTARFDVKAEHRIVATVIGVLLYLPVLLAVLR